MKHTRSRPDPGAMEKAGLPSREDVAGLPVREEVRWAPAGVDRRTAMKLMAASGLLSVGGPGCFKRKPYRKIVSMAETPEYRPPGKTLFYASTWTEGPVPYGAMIKTVNGRPIKIEGLPDHPLNRGTSSAAMQASILSLYDPDRLRTPLKEGSSVSWDTADREIVDALMGAKSVVLITRSSLGPSERNMVQEFLAACPGSRHFVHETVHDGPRRRAWKKIYGLDGEWRPRLENARIIVSIDSDFLGTEGAVLDATRAFAETRAMRGRDPRTDPPSRLYVIESGMTVTGSNADHRIPLKPSLIPPFLRALRVAVEGKAEELEAFIQAYAKRYEKELKAIAKDLRAHPGRSVVLAGGHLPEAVHAGCAILNHGLGAFGSLLEWNPSPSTLTVSDPSEIARALEPGVDVLLLFGVNPLYEWPGSDFPPIFEKAALTVGHGLYQDETLSACTFALPSTHNLESWNDRIPVAGRITVCQPVIAPIYSARQEGETLLAWTRMLKEGDRELARCKDWHDYVQRTFRKLVMDDGEDHSSAWDDFLRTGMAANRLDKVLADRAETPEPDREAAENLFSETQPEPGPHQLVIQPHHAIYDGRFANNAWLQEFPEPVSKLVWDNAAVIGPGTAEEAGLREGDFAALVVPGGEPHPMVPVLVQPGVAEGVVVATLGHGRTRAGSVGSRVGFNAAALLAGSSPTPRLVWKAGLLAPGGKARAGGASGRHEFVRTQKHFSMENRPHVIHGTAEEYRRDPGFVNHRRHLPEPVQIDPAYDYSKFPKWAMAVDLGRCTGCGSCMIACQAENNIPVVGRDECGMGREMSWIRVDRYHEGDPDNPRVYQQPMLCQHCDNAPCESVCPVNATSHSHEGINEQTYNRCVGTRYCANNCPYKVRRFNFYHYTGRNLRDSIQELRYNPQVTVRSRGVMEKCTFCVQRINEVKFKRKNEGKPVEDGAVRPACGQACPAGAIVFGDLNDPDAEIGRMRASSLAYLVLEELNVRPNVHYLARIRNPHPDVPEPGRGNDGHGESGREEPGRGKPGREEPGRGKPDREGGHG